MKIRDFGRGLELKHFVQNEISEKKKSEKNLFGQFGIGLKDAIAVLFNLKKMARVTTESCMVTFEMHAKNGHDITTLHCRVNPGIRDFVGTEITIGDISVKDLEEAKRLFLIYLYSNTQPILSATLAKYCP